MDKYGGGRGVVYLGERMSFRPCRGWAKEMRREARFFFPTADAVGYILPPVRWYIRHDPKGTGAEADAGVLIPQL